MNITIAFGIFELVLVPIFSSNWQFWFFGRNLPKEYLQSKTDKMDTTIEFCIFELVLVSNFFLSSFKFLDKIFPVKIFMVKIRKSEHYHWILHIQISLGTKLQLKLTILILWTKFTQIGISSRKQNKQSKDYKRLLFV